MKSAHFFGFTTCASPQWQLSYHHFFCPESPPCPYPGGVRLLRIVLLNTENSQIFAAGNMWPMGSFYFQMPVQRPWDLGHQKEQPLLSGLPIISLIQG